VSATEKPETSLKTFAGWETLFDRILKTVEIIVVLSVTGLLFFLVGREAHWAWSACGPKERQQRIEVALKMLHDDWKVGLLILVPLFYRTVRMFLERVRKAFGIELQQPDEGVVKKPNPKAAKEAEEEDEDNEEDSEQE
jgi:hypothetical protein